MELTSFLSLKWCDYIHSIHNPSFKAAFNSPIREVDKLRLSLSLGTYTFVSNWWFVEARRAIICPNSFLQKFFKRIFPIESLTVPMQACQVPIIS